MRASLLLLSISALVAAGCTEGYSFGAAPLLKELRGAPPLRRTLAPMLSVPVAYESCASPSGMRCRRQPPAIGAEWAAVAGRVAAAVEAGADPDALHAAAVLDLLTGATGNSLDRSISYLEMSTRIAPNSDRFVDLSAGYLVRSGRDADARSVIAALDAAARATLMDSTNAAAHFNLGLALRELGLYAVAREELKRVAAADPTSPWAHEGAAIRATLTIDTVVVPSGSPMTPDAIGKFARAHSHEARGLAWDRLAAWATATQTGDTAGAERQLRLAEAAGQAIAASHIDRAVADAGAAARSSAGDSRKRLAKAHIAYTAALRLGRMGRYTDAAPLYMEAQRFGEASPALLAWAAYDAANNALISGDGNAAERLVRRQLRSPAAERYPALAARLNWTLGVIHLRNGRNDEGASTIAASRDLYATLGESEYHGATVGQFGEGLNLAGDSRAAYGELAKALRILRNHPLSHWRHNTMVVLSRMALVDGYTDAAAFIDAEDDIASRVGRRRLTVVESQLTRARNALSRHDTAGARRAIATGRQLAADMPASAPRSQLEAEMAVEEVDITGRSGDSARAVLDTAIAYFTRISNYTKQLRAYSARAALAIRAGDVRSAEANLDAALSIYERRRTDSLGPTQRSLLAQQAKRVADALTLLRVGRGDARGAVLARERSRAAPRTLAPARRHEGLVLEFALVGDTLVTLASRGDVASARMSGGAGALRANIEIADLALERGAPEAIWGPLLEQIHGSLIAPIEPMITPADSVLTIIADGDLARVPFAALRDAKTGTYLMEHHAVRFVSSLRQAAEPRAPLPPAPRVLLVAEPTIDRRAFPALAPLPGAMREVDSIATLVERPRILRGGEVDTLRLKRALGSADVFHFAGHAVFEDARPERSQLAIASRGLTAQSIAKMRLQSLRLVVLSACATIRAPTGTGAGFLGLTDSFVAAGAGGVIGSLWKVDDGGTQTLMQAFYTALAKTREPALALRDAQRSMKDLSPRVWGAFKYAGK